jgi:septum formation protein
MTDPSPELILASTSPYRRALLNRLQLTFTVESPQVDETPQPAEAPLALAQRLALAKAQAVARHHPHALVIGADQVACCREQILGKPGSFERACAQLTAASGQSVQFLTAVALVRADSALCITHTDLTEVHFRALGPTEIESYVLRDQPYDCAGSFRSEGLGISLFDRIDSQDPTALVGLPLIWLSRALHQAGINLLHAPP